MTDDRAEPAGTPPDEWLVDRLLSAASPIHEPDPIAAAMSELVGALRGAGTPVELAGEGAAVTAFETVRTGRPRRHASRAAIVGATVGGKIALSAAVAAAATVAAAYAGVLPAPLQNLAHRAIHAPAPPQRGTVAPGGSQTTKGQPLATAGAAPTALPELNSGASTSAPAAPSSALRGLCIAYGKATNAHKSTAFRRLADLAGGASHVGTFCAQVAANSPKSSAGGNGAHGSPSPPGASNGHGKPTQRPSHGNSGKPKPSTTHSPGGPPSHPATSQKKS